MPKARNKNRLDRQRRNARSQQPLTKTQIESRRPERRQYDTWPHRFRRWIVTANKAVLAALGAGIIGIITASVTGLPHLIAEHLTTSPPLTVAGGSSPDDSTPVDPCELDGTYFVLGTLHPAHTVSTNQVSALVHDAANVDVGSTYGTYTLQAAPNETVVITAIHTVVLRRVPTPHATIVDVESFCPGAATAPPNTYDVSVNLDAANLTPKVQLENTDGVSGTTLVHGLQAVVTNGSPILIDFEADTSKYDVTWKLHIDYNVNGQQKTAWIQNGSLPFHTVAGRPDDTALEFTLNQDFTSWTTKACPFTSLERLMRGGLCDTS